MKLIKATRIVPSSSLRGREGLLRGIQMQLAREIADSIMDRLDLHMSESDITDETVITASVYIASEKEMSQTAPPDHQTASGLMRFQQEAARNLQEELRLREAAALMNITEEMQRKIKKAEGYQKPDPFTLAPWMEELVATGTVTTLMNPWLDEEAGLKTQSERACDWAKARYSLTERGELIMSKEFWKTGNQFASEKEPIEAMDNIQVLVDGDIIAYRCAATCDGVHYLIGGERFGYMKDAKAFADKKGLPNAEIQKEYEPEPLDSALHNCGVMMEKIRGYYLYERKLNPIIKTFMSAPTNFRHDLYPEYKANRKEVRRPHWLKECKQHLKDQFGAFEYKGYEADDLIAMTCNAMRDDKIVSIASCDKDFTQCGGHNVEQYDFTTGKMWCVSEDEAVKYFYKQILIGDSTDNIPGLHRVGSQTAIKMLEGATEERDLYNRVVVTYQEKEGLTTEDAVAAVQLRGSLLYLLRQENEIWKPPAPRSTKL
jgi:hypothetical protein